MADYIPSSVRPWFAKTHSVAFSWTDWGDWYHYSGLAIDGNQDYWVWGNSKTHFDGPYYGSLIKTSPDGNIDYSGCEFSATGSYPSDGSQTNGKIWKRPLAFTEWFISDGGNYLYGMNDGKIWRLHTGTGDWEYVVGGATNQWGVPPNGVGTEIGLRCFYRGCVLDGFLYFTHSIAVPTPSADGIHWFSLLRRLRLSEPYGVDTVPAFAAPPSGCPYPANSATVESWGDTINGSTGLPNWFNDDALRYAQDVATDGTYLYINGSDHIRRVDPSDWSTDVLFYGIGSDITSQFSSLPSWDGKGTPPAPYNNGTLGTPDLEGVNFEGYCIAISGDKLFFQNASLLFYTGGLRTAPVAYLDLEWLVPEYEANGPVRVNRRTPQWKTIANGNWHREANNSSIYTKERKHNVWRDGGQPVLSYLGQSGLHAIPGRTGAVACLQNLWAGDLYPGYASGSMAGGNDWSTQVVTHLIESPEFAFDVQLSFDGMAFKGYGPSVGLEKQTELGTIKLGTQNG